MKNTELLEAVGMIDEQLLVQAETAPAKGWKTARRILLAAAIISALAVTAVAVSGLLSLPVEGGQIISGETVAPFSMDAQGNIDPSGVEGLKVMMDVEVNEDAPTVLEEFYVLDLPSQWRIAGGGGAGDGYFYASQGSEWKLGNKPGKIRLWQDVTEYYLTSGGCVDTLRKLTAEDGVTATATEFAGLSVLRVNIPALPRFAQDPGIDAYYCVEGETRIYWTDGDYMLMFAYPQWISDGEAEAMVRSLEKETYIDPRPEGYGQVDPQRIAQSLPGLSFDVKNGTSCANSTMGLGSFAYDDGYIYCAGDGAIYRYDLSSGQTEEFLLSSKYAVSGNLTVAGDYILYTDTWSDLMALRKDGTQEAPVFQGFHLAQLYVDGTTVYTTEGVINVLTGAVTPWPEGVHNFYVEGSYVYALSEEENCFLRAPKGTMDFEKIPLSFCPVKILVEGEAVYLARSGKTWPVVHYQNGVETQLPICAVEYQVLDGKLIYRDEETEGRGICSYDLDTGEKQVLAQEGFNFAILEDRYVCICCADHTGQVYHRILDWQTGQQHQPNCSG